MFLRVWRFIAVMLAALTLGLGFCHLMQLPARMAWDQYLWVGSTVQGGLYAWFGSVGAMISIAAILVLALNAYFVKEHGRPGYCLALLAALLFALAFVLWWVAVYPANVEITKWVNGPVPDDWTKWRARWEWGHAMISLVEFAGLAALVWSVLADSSPSAVERPQSPSPKKRARR